MNRYPLWKYVIVAFALMIGVAEINGAKTEIDDAGEF